MVFRILTVFALVSSFLWITLSYVQAEEALPQGDFSTLKRTSQAEVIEVVNPLTVLLSDGRVARLAGIDIPDYTSESSGPFGVTARDVLRDMLIGSAKAKRANIYQTSKKGHGRLNRMGHHIAHLERDKDKAWAQGALVSLGLARVRTTKRNPEMATQMLALEAKARANKAGIWSDKNYKILTPEETEAHIGDFVITEGVIKSVALKKNRIYMNFGGNWRNDFTVSIPPEDKRGFSKAQMNPMSWGGQRVRVRGVLKSINGPYIEISHPEAIEFPDKQQEQARIIKTDKPAAKVERIEKSPLSTIDNRRSNP